MRQLILEEITESLIKYIILFYNSPSLKSKELDALKNEINPFFEMIRDDQDCIWKALSTLLENQIQTINSGENNEVEIEAIDLIMCALNDLFN